MSDVLKKGSFFVFISVGCICLTSSSSQAGLFFSKPMEKHLTPQSWRAEVNHQTQEGLRATIGSLLTHYPGMKNSGHPDLDAALSSLKFTYYYTPLPWSRDTVAMLNPYLNFVSSIFPLKDELKKLKAEYHSLNRGDSSVQSSMKERIAKIRLKAKEAEATIADCLSNPSDADYGYDEANDDRELIESILSETFQIEGTSGLRNSY